MAHQDGNQRPTAAVPQQVKQGPIPPAVLGPGITDFSRAFGSDKDAVAPQVKRLQAGEDSNTLRNKSNEDPAILKEIDTLYETNTDCISKLDWDTDNWRIWQFRLYYALFCTPIAQRILVGLEYGPGMNAADPLAYTSQYSERLDQVLGSILIRIIGDHYLMNVLVPLSEAHEYRATKILDALYTRYESSMSGRHSLVRIQIDMCKQGPTESIKEYGDRLQALYTRQWSIGGPESERTKDQEKAMHFMIGLRPEFKEDSHTYWRSVDMRRMMGRMIGSEEEESYRLDRVITFFENAEWDKKRMAERAAENATRESVGRGRGRGRGRGGRRGGGQGGN
ncbi:hypothetical protein A4X09_0g5074 [Tilletia walkeri]|uniref:Uncharacterized protein n=1 Tax=Tilletia walkeri TaxID=117179 RepID=A0A8X7N6F5_9BASI|nr:hypothetical protein A4X09_0g5074 [Tilletia walkeri]